MEITFRATEIGSYEDRGQLICGASNFKDAAAEYHYITLGLPSREGGPGAQPTELRVEIDNEAERRHYSVMSCLISPSAWRILFREKSDDQEPLSVMVQHSMAPEAYREFVQSLGALFAGRTQDLQVGDRL